MVNAFCKQTHFIYGIFNREKVNLKILSNKKIVTIKERKKEKINKNFEKNEYDFHKFLNNNSK